MFRQTAEILLYWLPERLRIGPAIECGYWYLTALSHVRALSVISGCRPLFLGPCLITPCSGTGFVLRLLEPATIVLLCMPGTQTQSGVTKSPYESGVYFVRGQTWQVRVTSLPASGIPQPPPLTVSSSSCEDWREIRTAETARLRIILRSLLGGR